MPPCPISSVQRFLFWFCEVRQAIVNCNSSLYVSLCSRHRTGQCKESKMHGGVSYSLSVTHVEDDGQLTDSYLSLLFSLISARNMMYIAARCQETLQTTHFTGQLTLHQPKARELIFKHQLAKSKRCRNRYRQLYSEFGSITKGKVYSSISSI